MSCNGCRVLRKGCNENCILRQSLQNIESPQAQANATVFVAKFFGRADFMSSLSSVPQSQRPALFQSLLFEACGRTMNPVNGAVGLLWTGNWHLCQSAVETVLRGGVVRVLPEFFGQSSMPESDESSEAYDSNFFLSLGLNLGPGGFMRNDLDDVARIESNAVVDLGLTSGLPTRMTKFRREKRRPATQSRNSEESETTTLESGSNYHPSLEAGRETKLLRLFF